MYDLTGSGVNSLKKWMIYSETLSGSCSRCPVTPFLLLAVHLRVLRVLHGFAFTGEVVEKWDAGILFTGHAFHVSALVSQLVSYSETQPNLSWSLSACTPPAHTWSFICRLGKYFVNSIINYTIIIKQPKICPCIRLQKDKNLFFR